LLLFFIIVAIGLAFGIIIYLANVKPPHKVKDIEKIEAIAV